MKNAALPLVLLRLLLTVFLLSSLLTACGFKLRGAVELPADIKKIYLAGPKHSELLRELRTLLAYSSEVVSQRSEADAILTIVKEEADNRTLSVDSRGKVRESEKQYSVIFNLQKADGSVLLENESMLLVRDFINDENDIIGRTNESGVIEQELKRDAAQQILRRLQAVQVNQATQ